MNGTLDEMFSKEQFFKIINTNKSNGTTFNRRDSLPNQVNFAEIQSLLNVKVKIKDSNNYLNKSSEMSATDLNKSVMEISDKKSKSFIFFLLNPFSNLVKTMILSYIWIALSMIYYGVSLGN